MSTKTKKSSKPQPKLMDSFRGVPILPLGTLRVAAFEDEQGNLFRLDEHGRGVYWLRGWVNKATREAEEAPAEPEPVKDGEEEDAARNS
jgi:hypothetical protein